jgi:hypothetical protein
MQALRLAQSGCECLHFATALDREEARAAVPGAYIGEMDGRGIDSRQRLLSAVAEALRFPDYFGNNWDATLDCLRDFWWLESTGYVLVVTNAAELWRDCARELGTLVEIWLAAAGFWSEIGVPFHLVFVW